jgi:SAM-dependent methyltransferase
VREWQELYESTYASEEQEGPSFAGWTSSYTGEALPAEQMQEWLQGTVERIRNLQPRRVLEIGCGIGLVLSRMAPECEVYYGTDFSGMAIGRLQRWLQGRAGYEAVKLSQRVGTDLEGIAERSLDTIILNSVVQYFPDMEYLLRVLEQAVERVRDGGRIYIGDVRNRELLEVFHSAVQFAQAEPGSKLEEIARRARRAAERDKELVIGPGFFRLLPRRLSRISDVDVLLKGEETPNELTRYRYDVVLRIGRTRWRALEVKEESWEECGGASGCLGRIERHLQERRCGVLRVRGVVNARLWREMETHRRMREPGQAAKEELQPVLDAMHAKESGPGRTSDWGSVMGIG